MWYLTRMGMTDCMRDAWYLLSTMAHACFMRSTQGIPLYLTSQVTNTDPSLVCAALIISGASQYYWL